MKTTRQRTACAVALAAAVLTASPALRSQAPRPSGTPPAADGLRTELDSLFSSGPLARALVGARVDSLRDGRTIYARNAGALVIPASNLKIVTMAVAADRLGWDHRFETRLEVAGPIRDGILEGDVFATGTGDPSIAAEDLRTPMLFAAWAEALRAAGIRQVRGRVIGDDDAFADEPLGAGWAWDYLSAGYAAPSGALSYNENVAVLRLRPGATAGTPVALEVGPPGHGLDIDSRLSTSAPQSPGAVTIERPPGSSRLVVRGSVAAGSPVVVRTTAVANPTLFFADALRVALIEHGIPVSGAAVDIDDAGGVASRTGRRLVARHESLPLSALVGYAMKVSQNFYGEMMLKALGTDGSTEGGRQVVKQMLTAWGAEPESLVMYDGSGLSRYNYVTSDLMVGVLRHVWRDERLRGPFAAALPVGGEDGTLQARMKVPLLDRRVQAKTGTINNVRALSGYLDTQSGDRLAFSFIANNYTAPNTEIDAVMERALERLASDR